MKLLIATPLYPPDIGGPATYAKLLEDELPKYGWEARVIAFGTIRHLPKGVAHLAYFWAVYRALVRVDAVLALDPVSVGLPALLAARLAGKPFFVKIVGDYAWEQGTQRFGVTLSLDEFVRTPVKKLPRSVRILRRVERYVARSAVKVIVPSPYLADIVKAWGISGEHIQIINNAIVIPEHLPASERKNKNFLIVSAGRRVPWKGFEALERVVARHPEWELHIASGVSREEALGWMKAADVFVLNSSYEGFPHTLIEAMTLGTPVIATDAKFHRHLVTDGVSGLLVPVGDDAALERALTEVSEHTEAAKARALAAEEKMKEFEVAAMLRSTASFLTQNI